VRGVRTDSGVEPCSSALVEDPLQDQGCDSGERECYQGIYDPDCDPPSAFLAGPVFMIASLDFIELVGLCHAAPLTAILRDFMMRARPE
jgi:hypothetical protein